MAKRTIDPVPRWAADPFYRCLNELADMQTLLHVTIRGISVLRGMPRIVEVLTEVDGENAPPDAGEQLARAQHDAEFATREVDRGFPRLHAQIAISLWGALEDVIYNFVVLLLQHDPDALRAESLLRMKVRLGDVLHLDQRTRAHTLVELLDKEVSGPLRQGVNRFESLLEPFGLSGEVPEKTRRSLFELQQLRNLHAHRGGLADRRFIEACPFLASEEGSYVQVQQRALAGYFSACTEYILQLLYRIAFRGGWSREEMDQHIANAKGHREEETRRGLVDI